jgi:hypothetical protein
MRKKKKEQKENGEKGESPTVPRMIKSLRAFLGKEKLSGKKKIFLGPTKKGPSPGFIWSFFSTVFLAFGFFFFVNAKKNCQLDFLDRRGGGRMSLRGDP